MRRFLRRRWKLIALVLFALYLGSYLILSRLGMAEMKKYNLAGFFYVPAEKALESEDWEKAHLCLAEFYAPLDEIDCALGTSRGHCRCILRGLSR